jgi:hypothetical protein
MSEASPAKPTGRTKSPLKAKPLRSAGQSLGEMRRQLFDDRLWTPSFMVVAFLMVTMVKWIEHGNEQQTSPWFWTICLAAVFAFWAYRFARAMPLARRLKQGEAGEKIVGEYLERLREQGYKVFHDVLSDGFNIDHVLIGPAGIFTIETKTWSKPAKGEAIIEFDGEAVQLMGRAPDRNPIIQARAQSGWLKGMLEECTQLKANVHPVILFPGWFIRGTGKPSKPIWVLEPKALPKWLANAEPKLTKAEVHKLSASLTQFIRNSERFRDTTKAFFRASHPQA